MPFDPKFDAIYRLIVRCCTEQGLECTRADEDAKPGKITQKIYEKVAGAGIVIADMTDRNANVFYELGLAHAISDDVILLAQSTDDVPFDLRNFLHIQYDNTFDGAEKLSASLSKALTSIVRSAEMPIDASVDSLPETPTDLEAASIDISVAHLQAEIARGQGDFATAADWLKKGLEAARLGQGDASEVGNCAIEAELCRLFDLAEALYLCALDREPGHVNNRQCYVSFILDHRGSDSAKLDKVGAMLADLEGVPERQERTRSLRAQYASKRQRSGEDVDMDAIIEDLLGDGEFNTLKEAAPALLVLQDAKRYDDMRTLVNRMRKSVDKDEIFKLDRVMADALAASGIPAMHDEAIELYDTLLNNGDDATPEVKHNLATLLYGRRGKGDGERANELWLQAYAERPSDQSIRKAFAQYLVQNKQDGEAQKVLEGQPL
ncbi:MAG: hypothetical protein AAF266_12875 [Planctomycetota bacterium]